MSYIFASFFNSHPYLFFITIIFIILAIVIIALRGKIMAQIGNKIFAIGKGDDENKDKNKAAESLLIQDTCIITPKRTCGDCILLLMGEREKFELNMGRETNKVLKAQMTHTEQKIIEIQNRILNNISDDISADNENNDVDESVQYKLIYGLMKDAFFHIKDEIRRSFKDNGFYEINGSEFAWYVKERTQTLTSMLSQYIRNIYPDRGGVLKRQKVLNSIEKEAAFLAGIVNDIYAHAREVRLECDTKVEEIRAQFGLWVDNFIT